MRDWSDEQVATFLKQNSANETYTNLYYKDGRAIANAWMKENAPWLPGYWIAYDSKDEFLRQFRRNGATTSRRQPTQRRWRSIRAVRIFGLSRPRTMYGSTRRRMPVIRRWRRRGQHDPA